MWIILVLDSVCTNSPVILPPPGTGLANWANRNPFAASAGFLIP